MGKIYEQGIETSKTKKKADKDIHKVICPMVMLNSDIIANFLGWQQLEKMIMPAFEWI
jgi:hypothetical protein